MTHGRPNYKVTNTKMWEQPELWAIRLLPLSQAPLKSLPWAALPSKPFFSAWHLKCRFREILGHLKKSPAAFLVDPKCKTYQIYQGHQCDHTVCCPIGSLRDCGHIACAAPGLQSSCFISRPPPSVYAHVKQGLIECSQVMSISIADMLLCIFPTELPFNQDLTIGPV